MTTLVRPDAPTGGGGAGDEAAPRPHEPSRYAAWRSSWAVALRMARRDVRRHQGRSALVVVMVAVPTLLLSTVVTIAATSDVAGTELIGPTMGNGQACVEGAFPDPDRPVRRPEQAPLGFRAVSRHGGFPDTTRMASPYANADAVSRVVGAPVVPMSSLLSLAPPIGQRRLSHRRGRSSTDARASATSCASMSGRWPQGTGQALVTPLRHRPVAFPTERFASPSPSTGTDHVVDVVGVASAYGSWGAPGLVVAEPLHRRPGLRRAGSSWATTPSPGRT